MSCTICWNRCLEQHTLCILITPTHREYVCGVMSNWEKIVHYKKKINVRKPLLEAPFDKKRKEGYKVCRWCGGELPKNRSAWCSNTCNDKYALQVNWNMMKKHIYLRDKGCCVDCNIEVSHTYNLDKLLGRESFIHVGSENKIQALNIHREKQKIVRPMSEIHHIIPVSEGGAMWDESNLVTVCHECHKKRHRELRNATAKKLK